jgi:hypothetical protein
MLLTVRTVPEDANGPFEAAFASLKTLNVTSANPVEKQWLWLHAVRGSPDSSPTRLELYDSHVLVGLADVDEVSP